MNINAKFSKMLMQFNDCQRYHRPSLTHPLHHDRGRVVFADSPRRGEYRALCKLSGWMLLRERGTAFGREPRCERRTFLKREPLLHYDLRSFAIFENPQ